MGFCSDFVDDLKSSRYFQVWGLTGIIFVVFVIIAVVQLGSLSELKQPQQKYRIWRMWEENSSNGIVWPDLAVMTVNPKVDFYSLTCNTEDEVPVQVQDKFDDSGRKYKYINSSQFIANPILNFIGCIVLVTNDTTLKWDTITPSGSLSSSLSAYVDSNSHSQITLKKLTFEDLSENVQVDWQPTVTYFSDPIHPEIDPVVTITITDFLVSHYQDFDWFTGWQFLGDIGGILFVSYLLHSLVLLVLSPCLPKDSVLCGGQRADYVVVD